MELVIPRKSLLAALDAVLPAVAQKSPMPIATTVQVTAEAGGVVVLRATDLLVSATSRTRGEVKKPGSVCVPAKYLRDLVGAMREGDITLAEPKPGALSVRGPGARKVDNVPTHPGEDFPSVPSPEGHRLTVPAAALQALLRLTAYAASEEDTRPHLSALLLEARDGSLSMTATDGHRLSRVERRFEGSLPAPCLIPKAFFDRVRLPEDGHVTLSVSRPGAPLAVEWGATVWTTKLVDAAFPSYDQVIPRDWDAVLTIGREEFAETLKALSVVASDRTSGVLMRAAGGRLTLTVSNPDKGDASDELPCEMEGSRRDPWLGFNAKYVLQVLASVTGPKVVLKMSGEMDPMRWEAPGEEGYVGVLMPLRVGGVGA